MTQKKSKLKEYDWDSLKQTKELGNGSFGKVRLLLDKNSNKCVVGKYMSSDGDERLRQKQLLQAKSEAETHATVQHENIIRLYGIASRGNTFVLLLEYAPYENLESFLHHAAGISIPWKLRARFFVELANALEYLHKSDSKSPFVHGDLKPQNILLAKKLVIKLADFGAAAIAKTTGATSVLTTTKEKSTQQHTMPYTAPEFLKDPTSDRSRSMDVYSYGMIGYEILTRKSVYCDSKVSYKLLIELIISVGQRPNESNLEEVDNSLSPKSVDSRIFKKLNAIVKNCWKFEPSDRPKISYVKKEVDSLAKSEEIFDKDTDLEIMSIIENLKSKKSNHDLNTMEQSSKATSSKVWRNCGCSYWLWFLTAVVAAGIARFVFYEAMKEPTNEDHLVEERSPKAFLVICSEKLYRYNLETKKTSLLLTFPFSIAVNNDVVVPVKVDNYLYLINQNSTFERDDRRLDSFRVNMMSKSNLTYEKIGWSRYYKYRSFVAYKDSILAVGGCGYLCGLNSKYLSAADLYNITTQTWTKLPDMIQKRKGPALVVVNDEVCVIGGGLTNIIIECYNSTSNSWHPKLSGFIHYRENAAAVVLNNTLYILGGDDSILQSNNVKPNLKFDLKNSTKLQQISDFMVSRGDPTKGVFDGKMYVVGGASSHLVESYDSKKNKWEFVQHLNFNQCNYKAKFIAI